MLLFNYFFFHSILPTHTFAYRQLLYLCSLPYHLHFLYRVFITSSVLTFPFTIIDHSHPFPSPPLFASHSSCASLTPKQHFVSIKVTHKRLTPSLVSQPYFNLRSLFHHSSPCSVLIYTNSYIYSLHPFLKAAITHSIIHSLYYYAHPR